MYNSFERLVLNNMILSYEHAEELKARIENALERTGNAHLYHVTISREASGYIVKTEKKGDFVVIDGKEDTKGKKIVRFRKVV